MSKGKVLFVLSNYGYWGEELVGPLEAIQKAGYEPVFSSPKGGTPHALPPSMDETYLDPPLGRGVTSKEMAGKVRNIEANGLLAKTVDISSWFPERPYFSAQYLVRELEKYYNARDAAWKTLDEYKAIVLVGGSGPIVDMVNNQRIHDLVLGFYNAGKPVAAECYGVAVLAFARDMENRKSIIKNKHVTGHCLEYDYKDGTGFLGVDFNMGPPPYPLEYILRDATAPDGAYIGNFGKEISVIVDHPFVTGRSTADSYMTGRKLVEVLESKLMRYGW